MNRSPNRPAVRPNAAWRVSIGVLAALLWLAPAGAAEKAVATIGVDEVVAGQLGYGISVFSGNRLLRFEVEVLGVMRDVQPDTDFILARLTGQDLETSGVIAGMSGSPVYLDERLAGAVAFSWPFTHGAIAGITPIGSMRRLLEEDDVDGGSAPAGALAPAAVRDLLASGHQAPERLATALGELVPRATGDARNGLQWSVSGFGARATRLMETNLAGFAMAGSAVAADPVAGRAVLEPGDAVAAVLIDGDLKMAATGTVTDRIGDDILAFGHPFLGRGHLTVPMATAEVITILSNQMSSFKIAGQGPIVGAFTLDRQAGIRGRLGQPAPTVPLAISIDGIRRQSFDLQLAKVPSILPILVAISTLGTVDAVTQSGGEQGLDLEASFELTGYDPLLIRQSFEGAGGAVQAAVHLLSVVAYLVQNRLEEVDLEAIDVKLTQYPTARTARLVGAHAGRTVVRPGETVSLNLDLVADRGAPFRHSLTITIPEGTPAGRYSLLVGDGATLDAARLEIERTSPVGFEQALDLLRSFHSRRQLMVMGVFAGQGLAVAGDVLPQLPGSLRSIWGAASSDSAVPLRLAIAQQQAEWMEMPIEGAVRIELEVRRRKALSAVGIGGAGDGGEETTAGAESGTAGGRRVPAPMDNDTRGALRDER